MQNRRIWLFLTLYGVLLVSAVSSALKGSRTKFKIATTSTTTPSTTTSDNQSDNENSDDNSAVTSGDVNATTGHTLTGIPQIDYIWDPNLPRELNGYNLSDYPFYNSIPKEEIDFKCDGLHDGFYASVPHKCQVYHHCLFGTRYDFLCANFTAFDQKTFICHFVSEVDCANSKKYWHRNDALYKAATTTTVPSPTTSTTTTTSTSTLQSLVDNPRLSSRRRIRPIHRRPAYDYYYDDELYYDDDYERPRVRGNYDRREEYDYDDRPYSKHNRERDRDYGDNAPRSRDPPERAMRPRDRFPSRNNRREPARNEDIDDAHRSSTRNHEESKYDRGITKSEFEEDTNDGMVKPIAPSSSVYARPRVPPKIRRPVPLSEQERFAYKTSPIQSASGDSYRRSTELPTAVPPSTAVDDYYDDEEDTRTRRPMRIRRPYRERERNFYDQSRDRDRDRDRPFRSRYREDKDEIRLRKYPERQREREHYYERSRDRALDRDTDYDRVLPDRERDHEVSERIRHPFTREKEELKTVQKEELKITGNKESYHDDEVSEPELINQPVQKLSTTVRTVDKSDDKQIIDKEVDDSARMKEGDSKGSLDKYKLDDNTDEDYYESDEYPSASPIPSQRSPAIKVVKRPFLPSRGGSPIPRGLSLVGMKALNSKNDNLSPKESFGSHGRGESLDNQKMYKTVYQNDPAGKLNNQNEESNFSIKEQSGSNSVQWRPHDSQLQQQQQPQQQQQQQHQHHHLNSNPPLSWNSEQYRQNLQANLYELNQSGLATEKTRKDSTDSNNLTIKQKLNEVPHQLQDIPESEYDVTLNEALTPSFHQESTLSNGYIASHHQPLNREPVLQSSENNYRISRPFNNKPQQLNHQSKSTFIPSPQFIPLTRVNNEQSSLQYFKTPETARLPSSSYALPSVTQSRNWREFTPNYS